MHRKFLKKLSNQKDINLDELVKLCWLVATFREDSEIGNQIIELFDKDFPSRIENLRSRYLFLYPFTIMGDWVISNNLHLITREIFNKLLGRNSGFYKEEAHFTAIGHMCLMVYLLQAIESGYLNKNFSEYTFIYSKNKIHNKLFAEIVKNYAIKLDVKIIESDKKERNFDEAELEVWPSQIYSDKGVLARKEYYELAKRFQVINLIYF